MIGLERWSGIGRSTGLVLIGGAIAVLVIALSQRFEQWTSSTYGVVDLHLSSTVLLGALCAGVAAYAAAGLRRSALGARAIAAEREAAVVARVGAGVGIVAMALSILALAIQLVIARGTDLSGFPPFAHSLGGLALILALSLVGASIGWLTGTVASAPLVLIASFIGFATLADLVPGQVFDFLGTSDGIGIDVNTGFELVRLLAVLGIAALALTPYLRSRAVRAGAVAALLVAVFGLGTVAPEPVRGSTASLVCGGRAPVVCVGPERRGRIEATSRELSALAAPLRGVVPDDLVPPDRYVEGLEQGSRDRASLQVADPRREYEMIYDVASATTRCYPFDTGVPLGRQDDAFARVLVWVATRGRTVPLDPQFEGFASTLPKDPVAAAKRIRNTVTVLRACPR